VLVVSTLIEEIRMLRKALLGLILTAGVAFAGDQKAQAPAASKAQAPAASKAQAPIPAKIVTQTVITKEYVPVEKRRKLLFRQLGSSKVETCTNCVDCPNCKK
jgi:hypothetical protein